MKIWIVTIDDKNSTRSLPYSNKDKAHSIAYDWCEHQWDVWFPNDRMPEDWQAAYERMGDCVGFMDTLLVSEFDLDAPEPNEIEEQYIMAAQAMYHDDECEVHDDAPVSIGEDGAFVQAWVWVPDEELSDLELLKKHGYRITSAEEFVKQAPLTVIKEVVAGAGGLDSMVLWSDEPDRFRLTLPTQDELLEEFKEYING